MYGFSTVKKVVIVQSEGSNLKTSQKKSQTIFLETTLKLGRFFIVEYSNKLVKRSNE